VALRQPGATQQRQQRTQGGPGGVQAHRTRTLVRRIEVGDHRHRRRRPAGVADGGAGAREGQHPGAAGHGTQRGECPADAAAPGHQAAAFVAVGHTPERHADEAEGEREAQPGDQAGLQVGEAELGLHRHQQHGQDLAVHEGQRRQRGQHEQRYPRPRRALKGVVVRGHGVILPPRRCGPIVRPDDGAPVHRCEIAPHTT
jgi:hypothetical protein